LTLDQALHALPYIIACESENQAVSEIDSNGKLSGGVLQYQEWKDSERMSGRSGDPQIRYDAVTMGMWALTHGYIGR
jgi:hypothetical protein